MNNNTMKVTMVRIYLTSESNKIGTLMKRLRQWEKLRGVTVVEAMTGFGRSGMVDPGWRHDFPMIVEFFDAADKVEKVLEDLTGFIESDHIVTWQAEMVMGNKGAS